MNDWIEELLTRPAAVPECATVAEWWPRHRALCEIPRPAIEQAILGGFAADRAGWAFASAYQAALRALVPDLPADVVVALCVTESGGNAPRAIRTALRAAGDGVRILDGAKRWTTLGPAGGLLLVVARDADVPGDTPALRVACVPAAAPGVAIDAMPPTSFVPEVPHAQLRLEGVRVPGSALLPGDGYLRYVKPFRTIEDLHIQAALLAHLVREGRRLGWPAAWLEGAIESLVALAALAARDPSSSATHVALAGALARVERLVADADALWPSSGDEDARIRWFRDRPLLGLAAEARAQRTARAWERLAEAENRA